MHDANFILLCVTAILGGAAFVLNILLGKNGWKKPDEIDLTPQTMPSTDTITEIPVETNGAKLYKVAISCLGKDMSPGDVAPDSLACAESLNGVFKAAFGLPIGTGNQLTSTFYLWKRLLVDPRFVEVTKPITGDIVISPTGTSTGAQHGHCGVWGNYDVMSNDSTTGKWMDNYTHKAWYDVFQKKLGFPVYFFRVK